MPSPPIAFVSELLIYARHDDLPTDDQEIGNLAVVLESPTLLFMWANNGWLSVGGDGVDLTERVARLEQRLVLAAERLTEA